MPENSSPLGKGLAALLSEDIVNETDASYVPDMNIGKIIPNPDQPRLEIAPETLIELADSIREHGIIEPLIVSKRDDQYMIIAGERRWRAAQLANVPTVPIVIRETSPQQMLELAIVENVQRKDLNPLEEALAFQQLFEIYNVPIPEIAKKVGLSRPAVSNKMRLLQLPKELKEGLLRDEISEGHARALLGLSTNAAMVAALQIVKRDKLSVRGTEELVRKLAFEERKRTKSGDARRAWSERAMEIKDQLTERFALPIKLTRSRRGGKIIIPFKTDEELEEIYRKFGM